jgi:hypothetical protein
LVLIIDALNQLDEIYNAHSLDWLPRELPKVGITPTLPLFLLACPSLAVVLTITTSLLCAV